MMICLNIFFILLVSLSINGQQPQSKRPNQPLLYSNLNNTNLNANRNRQTNCLRGDCYPETGDLLIGRTKFLHASSTCGLTQPERYCVLGSTKDATKCFVCDSSEPYDPETNTNSHTIENIVSRKQGDRFNRWWQSENGKQDVYIQFDLEAEFAFTHIIMTFKTFRPAAMIIEKSSNFGRTWKTYGYFASNCAESFPDIPTDVPKNLGDVYCESKYSSEIPSTKGEVVFKILPPSLIQFKDPYSKEIQDLLKITNLRINFTRLRTFGDNLLDTRGELKEKYYYALYEMVVRGSCLCYGHASRCIPVNEVQYDLDKNGMVDGQCLCEHNTRGTNCEQCLPLYNDRPWQPARSGQTNECKKCQCNNHALSCHFDRDLYAASNMVSGGVCDDCKHNTEGINCEKCKENYWRDPERGIDDPSTCKPCLCDPNGSTNDGKCDPYTNETLGLVAGRCHCKPLVEGQRCDRCQNGFFNLTKENPDGCEPCSCNLIGTTGNLGCDKITGLCSCKQFVTGRACDQCLPGYFGLSSDDPNGCKPCDCSPGGSYDSSCDVETGQCNCRPNMVGRTCDKPENGFYCPTLDHFVYEAETAKKLDQRSQDYSRPFYPDQKISWSGAGYVRVFEGASLEFFVDNIYKAGHYEILIRYENQQSTDNWEDLRISIVRTDGPPDFTGLCADYSPQDDEKFVSLPADSVYHLVKPPSCFEPNKRYIIKLDFVRFSSNLQIRDSSILIDSIGLIPLVEDLPALQGPDSQRLIEEFRYYGCREAQLNKYKEDISPNCAKFICNIGLQTNNALACDCNPTGSTSNICNPNGGMCQCKPNVIGRKCDKCAPGTWGFGPNGCQPCNCNSGGAKNNLCDLETGQCDCYEKVQGKQCEECEPNYWRFPTCEPCNCNGFADSCNQTSGQCINCRDHTFGYNCESCEEGYYGKPTAEQACKECMCPGGITGNKFASTCYFDPQIDGVVCNCKEGYIGYRCDKCAINYYGNPMEKGGSCNVCECNGNTDITDPNSCDQATGKCKNCLYNTGGDHCEICKPGYYGNASNHECRPCSCHPMGTETHSSLNCDHITGQCACLPNVIGRQCDTCKPDHYGLESGEGCSDCNCDVDGTRSNSKSCDQQTGECDCIDSRGGRTCSECSYGYWGDPNVECKKCECSTHGSISSQCDKINGSCSCRKGITGYYCDTCDRGTTGEVPYCTQCGECFDDWTDIMNDLKNQLENLEEKASNLAVASGTSVNNFTGEYVLLEDKLSDIKKILATNFTDRQIKSLNDIVQNIEKQLAAKKDSSKKYYDIEKWTEENPEKQLDDARSKYASIKIKTDELAQQAMNLKESHEAGAIDSIKRASIISQEASDLMDKVDVRVDSEFKPILDTLEQRLSLYKENFDKADKNLKDYYKNVIQNLTGSLEKVSNLNQAVCGELVSESQRCNPKCGGSDCDGRCGTNSSVCSGLVDSYWNVVGVRQNFEELYTKQELVFKRILTKLRNTSNLLNNANKDVKNLLEYANSSLQSINNKQKDLENLMEKVENFTKSNSEKPAKIKENCDYSINKDLELNESELDDILNKISNLASKINIDEIKRDAEANRMNTQELVKNSEKIASHLPGTLAELNRTSSMLELEKNKTETNEKSFDSFKKDNDEIQDQLKESEASVNSIAKAINETQNSIDELKNSIEVDSKEKITNMIAKQETLKSKVKESGVTLERTKLNLETLRTKLDELTKTFQNLITNQDTNKNGGDVLESLINLQSSINKKKNLIDQKTSRIENLQKNYEETKTRISKLQQTLATLKEKAMTVKKEIQAKEKYFNSCG